MTDADEGRHELVLLVNAWLQRREVEGIRPEFRARITDVILREHVGASSPELVHAVIEERLRRMIDEGGGGPVQGTTS